MIKTQDIKEADKLVWIFTEKLGKLTSVAKGAKRSKSRFLSLTLPFCYADYLLYSGRNLFSISEGSIISSFQELLVDLDSITYASYLCELIDIALPENESNREVFKNLVSALYFLKSGAVDKELIARAFEVKLLHHTGYGLNLGNCCFCKAPLNISDYINTDYYGGICSDCERVGGIKISNGAYKALEFINSTSMDKVLRINLSVEVKNDLYRVLNALIVSAYGRKPKSLEIFN